MWMTERVVGWLVKLAGFFISAMVFVDVSNRVSEVAKKAIKMRHKQRQLPPPHKHVHKSKSPSSFIHGSLELCNNNKE